MLTDKKILITGAKAQLGFYLQKAAGEQSLNLACFDKDELDITQYDQLKQAFDDFNPKILINCAADNLIDRAEDDSRSAYSVNSHAVEQMASLCRQRNTFLVHFSSAHVFDGLKNKPYVEKDSTNPINVYGRSKLKGEQAIQSILDDYLILRLSWVFGKGKNCFLTKVQDWIKNQRLVHISSDEISIPTYGEDVAHFTLRALQKGLMGLYHLTCSGQCSRFEYVRYYISQLNIPAQVEPSSFESFQMKAKRPLYSCMSNAKFCQAMNLSIPDWKDGLNRFVAHQKSI